MKNDKIKILTHLKTFYDLHVVFELILKFKDPSLLKILAKSDQWFKRSGKFKFQIPSFKGGASSRISNHKGPPVDETTL